MAEQINDMTDPSALRVFANSERMRVLAVLRNVGPCSVGEVSVKTGLAPGSVSYHLKRLAAAGLAEKSEGRGDKRQSWWKATSQSTRTDDGAMGGLGESEMVAMRRASSQSYFGAYARYLDAFENYDERWHGSELGFDAVLWLNPNELDELGAELESVVRRWADKSNKKESDREQVVITLRGFPWIP